MEDEEPGQLLVYGSLIVTDSWGDDIVYHRPSVEPEKIKGPGEFLSLTGPCRTIIGSNTVAIRVNLWVKLWDHGTGTEITKEIAKDEVEWAPICRGLSDLPYNEPLEAKLLGKHGSVKVGYYQRCDDE